MSERFGKIRRIAVGGAWALVLVALPVTSFPFFPGAMGGETLVRPLSIYPLILLVILATLPNLFRRRLPATLIPLFAFGVVALLASVMALGGGSDTFLGISLPARMARNLLTLGIGFAFFLTAALLPENWEDLRSSLRWIFAGFAIALAWGTLQAVYVVAFNRDYFDLISSIQDFVSTRRLFTTRVSGMTYEPKWFADQICFLLMPWLLAAVVGRQTVFRWRFRGITLELILLLWAGLVLLFTFSRTGLAILLLYVVVTLLFFRPRREGAISEAKPPWWRGKRVLQAALAVLMLGTVIVAVGSQNRYFSRLWRYFTQPEVVGPNRTFLEFVGFRQRFAYAETAVRIYAAHPVLGVGLGNYAFYFEELLPDLSWSRYPEIIRYLTPGEEAPRLITPKNLFARLLAETGLIGTITFTAFVLAIAGCALYLWLSASSEAAYWGLAGLLALLAFPILVFSFDSLALPNMWIVFGLLTAAAHLPESVT